MAVADPERKAVWPGEIARIDLRDWRNMWQTCDRDFNPGRGDKQNDYHRDSDQNGRSNPDPEATVWRIMYRRVFSIEVNHDL